MFSSALGIRKTSLDDCWTLFSWVYQTLILFFPCPTNRYTPTLDFFIFPSLWILIFFFPYRVSWLFRLFSCPTRSLRSECLQQHLLKIPTDAVLKLFVVLLPFNKNTHTHTHIHLDRLIINISSDEIKSIHFRKKKKNTEDRFELIIQFKSNGWVIFKKSFRRNKLNLL